MTDEGALRVIPLDRTAVRRASFRSRPLRLPLNVARHTGTRPNDLFVASYPRSGTTWLRFLLYELLTEKPAEFVSVNRDIPYIGRHHGAPALLPSGGRVIQTHEAFLHGVSSAIYVVRDPGSVVLSEYRWQLMTGLFEGSFESFFDAFIDGTANPYARWDRHVHTWLGSRLAREGRLHLVRFADLRADAIAELEAILSFLGVTRERSFVETVVANNELSEMRMKEERAPEGALGTIARPDIRFVDSASNDSYRHELFPDEAQIIQQRFERTLRRLEREAAGSHRQHDVRTWPFSVMATPTAASERKLKVLYIAGWGRSGSTLLDSLLGQIDGFFSTGELRYIWERGVIGDWACGCGTPVKMCPRWSKVLTTVAENSGVDARTILGWQRDVTRFRHTRKLLKRKPSEVRGDDVLLSYVAVMQQLFYAIREATGARVIVDSSKRPSDAAALRFAPDLDLYVVHLVRDPRAVAYSWQKNQAGIDRHSIANSTASWVGWNLATDRLREKLPQRSMLVRYETFAEDPHTTLMRIVELVGEDPSAVHAPRGSVFDVAETHMVSGNPSRFRTGPIEVRPDDEWRHRFRLEHNAAATMIALPLLRRYDYSALEHATARGKALTSSVRSARPSWATAAIRYTRRSILGTVSAADHR